MRKVKQWLYLLALLSIPLSNVQADAEKTTTSLIENILGNPDVCQASYGENGVLNVPCVDVAGVSYAVTLQQTDTDGDFVLVSATPIENVQESACIATYSVETGRFEVPCLQKNLVLYADDIDNPISFNIERTILHNVRDSRDRDLSINFIPQVPPGNWSSTKNCGPASVLMAMSYYSNEPPISDGIKAIDDWLHQFKGKSISGYNGDYTSVDDMLAVAKAWGFEQSERFKWWAIDDLKRTLDQQIPIVVAIVAKYITNRGYNWGGGHFITLIGYNENGFIVNDPGTSRGGRKTYSYEEFKSAFQAQGGAGLYVKKSSIDVQLGSPAKGSENVDPIDTVFSWSNPIGTAQIYFTLREYDPILNKTGSYVGDCGTDGHGKLFSVRETIRLSNDCGVGELRPNKWYKWAVNANVGNGSSAFFKTTGNTKDPILLSPALNSMTNSTNAQFEWNLNNFYVKNIDFTLREFIPDNEPNLSITDGLTGLDNAGGGDATGQPNGERGSYVGSCGENGHGKTLSNVVTNITDIQALCGASLKENQWYKWAIGLRFGDDIVPTKGASGYFKTKSNDTYFWTGNGSIISYYGAKSAINLSTDTEFPYGVKQDTTMLHEGNPVGFFQWQVTKNSCERLKIYTQDNKYINATITIGKWNSRDDDITFKDVTLPFVIGESNTGYSFEDNSSQWRVVGVAFKGVTESARLNANCTNDDVTNKSPEKGNPIILEGGYKWNGNASIISRIYQKIDPTRDFFTGSDIGEWPYGVSKDVTKITPASNSNEKPTVFFQWMKSDNCQKLKVDSNSVDKNVDLFVKSWSAKPSDAIHYSVTLPYTLSPISDWTVIQVAFKNYTSTDGRVEVTCQ